MEIPVQVAVRLRPIVSDDSVQCFLTNPTAQIVLSHTGQSYQVNQALPFNCSQEYVYSSVVATQLSCFLEGCDTSLVLLGQSNTGKSYTLLGPNIESQFHEPEQGIIPRFLRDTFARLNQLPDRSFILHITWMQVVQESIVDLLGSGLVKCTTVNEALHFLQLGRRAQSTKPSHTIFTVSIEQKWVDAGGILYHRLSTASFCELAAFPEPSLAAVENVIKTLISPASDVPIGYEQSLITAMLRDSLGGRAYTWIICCASPLLKDAHETFKSLELAWCCQGIKNFVTVNSFADNNTQVQPEKNFQQAPETVLGLQFAAEQWIKLVNNAENIFHQILRAKVLSEEDCSQVTEWLMLKAECNECLKEDVIGNDARKQGLPRIAEDTEPSEPSDSDDESDSSVNRDGTAFRDKLDKYMEYFREKTDEIVSDKNDEYLKEKCDTAATQDKRKGSARESRYDSKQKKNTALKHVSSRISHLDDILKEKSSNLRKSELSTEKEMMLRKEINNLRKTRECLHSERCSLGIKRKTHKSLSDSEERKLLECEEAIEAIDTAIEFKNALICGRSPSEMSGASTGRDSKSSQGSKGDLMLLARLDKLSHDETKTLLYKYFQKVVDLRGACAALEGVVATAVNSERSACPCMQIQTGRMEHARRNANISTRQYHQLQRIAGPPAVKSNTHLEALVMQDNSCDEALKMAERMHQLVKYHRDTTIPNRQLRQLMPATTLPTAKVTRLRNKLVIIQEDRSNY